jgi:hypothetical protein
MGHVRAVRPDEIVLDHGQIPLNGDDLVVNCSASGISRKPPGPFWAGNRINLQLVRTCQPLFSTAFTGFIEATFPDDRSLKNSLCTPVPFPIIDTDWLRMLAVTTKNRFAWREYPQIDQWLAQSRLNGFFAIAAQAKPEETAKVELIKRFQGASSAAVPRLSLLLSSLDASPLA